MTIEALVRKWSGNASCHAWNGSRVMDSVHDSIQPGSVLSSPLFKLLIGGPI